MWLLALEAWNFKVAVLKPSFQYILTAIGIIDLHIIPHRILEGHCFLHFIP